jgi:hypothetical protein
MSISGYSQRLIVFSGQLFFYTYFPDTSGGGRKAVAQVPRIWRAGGPGLDSETGDTFTIRGLLL